MTTKRESPPSAAGPTKRIPFLEAFRDKLVYGEKTCTSRNKRYGDPGELFWAFGETFVLTYVERLPLAFVSSVLWKEEGMSSPEEFRQVWCEIHPRRGYDGNQEVWVHKFKRVVAPSADGHGARGARDSSAPSLSQDGQPAKRVE